MTIGAPFVNEEEEPVPMIVIIVISSIQLIIALFFKNKSDLDKMQKVGLVFDNEEDLLKNK